MKKLILLLIGLFLISCGDVEKIEDTIYESDEYETDAPEAIAYEESSPEAEEMLLQTAEENWYRATVIKRTIQLSEDSLIGTGTVKYKEVLTEAHDPGYIIDYVIVDNPIGKNDVAGYTYTIDQKEIEEYFYAKSAGLTMEGVPVFSNNNQHIQWLVFYVAEKAIKEAH